VFHASPPAILPGGSSTLSWCVDAGTVYQLTPGPVTFTGPTNYVVSPSVTTTYSLIASNSAGVTVSFATVTVVTGGPCNYDNVTSWDCTLSFSYELTPSSADLSFMIRQEGHLTIHLTPDFVSPLLSEFSGPLMGNLQLNDLEESLGIPLDGLTLIGSGAPSAGNTLALRIDCSDNAYSFATEPSVPAVLAYLDGSGSSSYDSPLGLISVDNRPLPVTPGELSGSEFLPAHSFATAGENIYIVGGDVLAGNMVSTGTRDEDNIGSASITWSFTPNH
jgi:hypothetical protein